MKQEPKVLIVGAGPTGMTAAHELSRMQIPVRIIEKTPAPATTSRAVGVQARTLELFGQRGLVEPLLKKGNRVLAGSIYGEGKRVFRLDFSHNGSQYGYMLFVSQAETEEVVHPVCMWKEDEAAFNCQAAQVSPSNRRTATLSRN
jgi:2-polyprenyl-6-methoxyphenol hydroxylase-like FAD-dependent oxidoreductase